MIDTILLVLLMACGGLGYFTIWRLTRNTQNNVFTFHDDFYRATKRLDELEQTVSGLEQSIFAVKHEISEFQKRLQGLEVKIMTEFDHIKKEITRDKRLAERETKLVELGENLRLITKK